MIKNLLAAFLVPMALIASAGAADAADSRWEPARKKPTSSSNTTTLNPLRVIDHNIAGGAIHEGSTVALNRVSNHIQAYNPHVVMMQEVCASQVEAFKRWYPTWNVTVSQTRFSQPGCADQETDPVDPGAPNGDEQYDVVASPRPMRNPTSLNLGEASHSREQWLTCAEIAVADRWLTACTTHIKVQWAIEQSIELGGMEPGQQERQIQRIADFVTERLATSGTPVVVAGDFNAQSSTPSYAPMLRWQEYDFGRIDHVVYSGMKTSGLTEGWEYDEISDHKLLRTKGWFK